ncbi:serine hydrolase [Actinocorallia longicatena]|uniref:Serine hydrolase n=1 Tax=Actinocorallia longicatena TaxID=111803 RepID=A0ABP6QFX8_9ACTN
MRRLLALSTVVLLSGCGGSAAPVRTAVPVEAVRTLSPGTAVSPATSVPPAPAAAAPVRKSPREAVERYLKTRPGRASVMVRDLRTGATFGYHQHERYITASVMKVNILVGLLAQDRRVPWGTAGQMIRHSDNTAADSLYRLAGRGPGMGRVDRRLGLNHTVPFPTVWGATRTDPDDQVKLLGFLAGDKGPLSAAERRRVLHLMETVTPDQRWGIGAAARRGDRVANKNGWTPVRFQGSGWSVHSIGRITGHGHDYLVAVFSAEQPSMETGVRTVEGLARIAVGGLR